MGNAFDRNCDRVAFIHTTATILKWKRNKKFLNTRLSKFVPLTFIPNSMTIGKGVWPRQTHAHRQTNEHLSPNKIPCITWSNIQAFY